MVTLLKRNVCCPGCHNNITTCLCLPDPFSLYNFLLYNCKLTIYCRGNTVIIIVTRQVPSIHDSLRFINRVLLAIYPSIFLLHWVDWIVPLCVGFLFISTVFIFNWVWSNYCTSFTHDKPRLLRSVWFVTYQEIFAIIYYLWILPSKWKSIYTGTFHWKEKVVF